MAALKRLTSPSSDSGADKIFGANWNDLYDSLVGDNTNAITIGGTLTAKGAFRINNPADTFYYDITPAAIAANRTLNLPLLTGTDTIAVLDLAQTFTNKTLSGVVSPMTLGSTTFSIDFLGTTVSTMNVRARGSANSKLLMRLMPQGTGDGGEQAELTLMGKEYVDGTENNHWVDLKVSGTNDFVILTDRTGTDQPIENFYAYIDLGNEGSGSEQFTVVRDGVYGAGTTMFRVVKTTGITDIEGGQIYLSAGNFVFGTAAGDTVVRDEVFRPYADVTTDIGTGAFGIKGLYFGEISDPSAPSGNHGVLYCKDNGAGKTQLVVRFPSGAVQTIATEP